MNWRERHQLTYTGIILLIVLTVLSLWLYPKINKKSSCSDGKKNGTELGIDCGGNCAKLCEFQVKPGIVLWARSYVAAGNIYNSFALVSNQNVGSASRKVGYEFRLYDSENVFITSRRGETFILPNGLTPIFETSLDVGKRVPTRTTFTLDPNPVWEKVPVNLSNLPVRVSGKNYELKESSTHLSATISNDSLYHIPETEVMAVIYGQDDNVFAVSKTVISDLPRGAKNEIFFTWNDAHTMEPKRIDIIPKVNIFKISK